jgi:hypothetical protein
MVTWLLQEAAKPKGPSALARTIADLAGSDKIAPQHLAEALQYMLRMSEG